VAAVSGAEGPDRGCLSVGNYGPSHTYYPAAERRPLLRTADGPEPAPEMQAQPRTDGGMWAGPAAHKPAALAPGRGRVTTKSSKITSLDTYKFA